MDTLLNRRDAVRAIAGAGIALAAVPQIISGVAPGLLSPKEPASPVQQASGGQLQDASSRTVPRPSASSSPSSSGDSMVIHVKNGMLIAYKGMNRYAVTDTELLARISATFER
jgi:hypothetical protein